MGCSTTTIFEDGFKPVRTVVCEEPPPETEPPVPGESETTTRKENGAGQAASSGEFQETGGAFATKTIKSSSHAVATSLVGTTANADLPTNAAATITATQAPNAFASSPSESNGLSNGAIAGIAVGTAIIGAAIAFAIAFLLFKRKRRESTLSVYSSTPEITSYKPVPIPYVQEIPPPAVATAVIDRGTSHISSPPDFLASVLPPGADDRTVAERVGALFIDLQNHVENFYRDVHASVTPSMEGDLSSFGTGGFNVLSMLQTSSSPTAAIKHALVGYVLSITSSDGKQDSTLFPSEVVGVGGQEQFNNSDLSAAYVLYKRLSVHLHSSIASASSACQSDIREAAEHFSMSFFPWANPAYDQEKDDDLVQIISNALDLSIWLYGQPFATEYLWETRSGRGLVVAPQLLKVSDASGRVDGRPQVLLDPVVVSV